MSDQKSTPTPTPGANPGATCARCGRATYQVDDGRDYCAPCRLYQQDAPPAAPTHTIRHGDVRYMHAQGWVKLGQGQAREWPRCPTCGTLLTSSTNGLTWECPNGYLCHDVYAWQARDVIHGVPDWWHGFPVQWAGRETAPAPVASYYDGSGHCYATAQRIARERLTAAQCAEMSADYVAMGVL